MFFAGALVLCLSMAMPGAAQKPAKTAASQAKSTGLPKGATEVSPGVWRYTDKDGKVWTYTKTPFGLMRSQAQADAPVAAKGPDVSAFDEGESVRFERNSPMGKTTWRRKKSDLNALERAAWERTQKPEPAVEQQPPAEAATAEAPKQE